MPKSICSTKPTNSYDYLPYKRYGYHCSKCCSKTHLKKTGEEFGKSSMKRITIGHNTHIYCDREAIIKNPRGPTPPSPSSTLSNIICVKQADGKDFTISLSPPCLPKNNKSKVSSSVGKENKLVSIVIHSTPKSKKNTHPCFNTLADRKSNAVIDAMKRKISYKIHSPADNLKISLVGDTLAQTIGTPKSHRTMTLKGGSHGCSSPHAKSGETKCESPQSPRCSIPQDQYNTNVSNNPNSFNGSKVVQLNMPGSGVKLNIKIGKGSTEVCYGNSPTTSNNDFEHGTPKSASTCNNQNNIKSCNDNLGLSFSSKCGGYSQHTISSLIASRMTQLKREMSMNSLIQHAPAPPPPFINF